LENLERGCVADQPQHTTSQECVGWSQRTAAGRGRLSRAPVL